MSSIKEKAMLKEKAILKEKSLRLHSKWRGKFEISSTVEINTKEELSIAYTPGVAEPCLAIQRNPELSYEYTRRWNLVAVITDGTAVLGLGDIGPEAGMPVMEGKCILFKRFADIDAVPICIKSKSVEDIVATIRLISGSFGGINLEDISAPRCFEIEKRLKEVCNIPIFHDDQHGTAIVTLAAVINSLKIVNKDITKIKAVVNGPGAAGIAITKLLMKSGLKNVIMCDEHGALYEGREDLEYAKAEMSLITNREGNRGKLRDVIKGADLFIGVSAPDVLKKKMVESMAKDAIVFAMANPNPEIMPDDAKAAGARIVGTGRSDFPNQINNLLAFPGVFRGALDVKAWDINDEMKLAAAKAIAEMVSESQLNENYIIPLPFEEGIAEKVAKAVEKAAKETGVIRK